MKLTITSRELGRAADIGVAVRLTWLSIGWVAAEGLVSVWLGVRAKSLLLESFGFDSGIELIGAFVVLFWLTGERVAGIGTVAAERIERTAAKFSAALLAMLCVYIAISGVLSIWIHSRVDTHMGAWGILIGLTAKIGMPILARAKLAIAARLESRALRADAMEAITCGYLSVALVVGLAVSRATGWQWVDAAVSMAIVPLIAREAREAWRGECACHGARE